MNELTRIAPPGLDQEHHTNVARLIGEMNGYVAVNRPTVVGLSYWHRNHTRV